MKKAISLLIVMVLCFSALAACGSSTGDKAKIDTITGLQNETVALQEEIVAMLNDAIADGVEVDANFQNQVNDTSAAINEMSDLINGGELEKTANDELDTTIATMNTTLSTLKTMKTDLQAAIDAAYAEGEEQAAEGEEPVDEEPVDEEPVDEGGDTSAKLEEVYSLIDEANLLWEGIVENVTIAEEEGIVLSEELAEPVAGAGEALDLFNQSAESGELEQMTDEELDGTIETMLGHIELLTELSDQIYTEVYATE